MSASASHAAGASRAASAARSAACARSGAGRCRPPMSALVFVAIIFLAPPFYMLVTSLKTSAEIANPVGNPWLVRSPTLENYSALIGDPMFRASSGTASSSPCCVVALTMVISVLAAFALARMRFWGSQVLATGVFLTYLVPDTLLFIPLYQIVGGARPAEQRSGGWCWSTRR